MVLAHDAIVLAGGTGRRMGGVLKPQITVRGRRLLDHVLDATRQARRVVVVAPEEVPVPPGVTRTLEDPPHGGPVAGIAAGLAALAHGGAWAGPAGEEGGAGPAELVLVLACDVPGAARAVPSLLAEVARRHRGQNSAVGKPAALGDGAVVTDGQGRAQWLLGLYATRRLTARIAELSTAHQLRDCSVRRMAEDMTLTKVPAGEDVTWDLDTWADLDAANRGDR